MEENFFFLSSDNSIKVDKFKNFIKHLKLNPTCRKIEMKNKKLHIWILSNSRQWLFLKVPKQFNYNSNFKSHKQLNTNIIY